MSRNGATRIGTRIFVVGAPRSGTTLVQGVLAAHPGLTSFTESHFFSRHFTPLPAWRGSGGGARAGRAVLTRDPGPRVREFLAENGSAGASGRPPSIPRFLLPLRTATVARRLIGVLDDVASARGVAGWVEKTPRHVQRIGCIERACRPGPAPRFVHVVRRGIDVVGSLREASRHWDRAYDLDECVRRWNGDLAITLARAGFRADVVVAYEDLVADPSRTAAALLDALGLEPDPEILERRRAEADRWVAPAEQAWKPDPRGDIRPTEAPGRLTTEERRRIETGLRADVYERLLEVACRGPGTGSASRRGTPARTGDPEPRDIEAEDPEPGADDPPSVRLGRQHVLLSVVVPFFDVAATLERCIASLETARRSVDAAVEVLLVDNGSRDGSADLVPNVPGVTVLHEATPGAYAARNAAIERARGSIVAFTDADCEVDPDWLAAILDGMSDPAVAVLVGHCRPPREATPALRALAAWENAKARHVLESCPPAYRFAWANNMAVRAAVFRDLGPFRTWRRAGDTELVHRLAARRPDLAVRFRPQMRVTHLEFLTARSRARRLGVYTSTNAKIDGFRELEWWRRLGVLAAMVRGREPTPIERVS